MQVCAACGGQLHLKLNCDFCGGSGEYNLAADSMMNRDYGHPCQCSHSPAYKSCTVCSRPCHHTDTHNRPKIELSPIV